MAEEEAGKAIALGGCSGVRLSFVRKQEPAKGGIAFSTKNNLQHLIEAKPKAPAAALLPQLAAEDPLSQMGSVTGPIEVTVFDPALGSNYKRQVHLVTLSQSTDAVCHSLPTPAISLTIADVAELILECDARVVSKDLFNAFNDNPIHRFKTVLKEHCEVDFWANSAFYSYKCLKPRDEDKGAGIHQCVLKAQKAHRAALLSFSGI